MSVVDDYLAEVEPVQRAVLEHTRAVIKGVVPDAEEVITYGMPGFKYRKKYLIAFAEFKDHLSVFPGAEAVAGMADDLKDFTTSKGTVQFTLEQPLPDEIIIKLVTTRQRAIDN
jgi:uncharacterized protein YdhG (YjbR/CyaY superfamily)